MVRALTHRRDFTCPVSLVFEFPRGRLRALAQPSGFQPLSQHQPASLCTAERRFTKDPASQTAPAPAGDSSPIRRPRVKRKKRIQKKMMDFDGFDGFCLVVNCSVRFVIKLVKRHLYRNISEPFSPFRRLQQGQRVLLPNGMVAFAMPVPAGKGSQLEDQDMSNRTGWQGRS